MVKLDAYMVEVFNFLKMITNFRKNVKDKDFTYVSLRPS